MPRVKPPTDLLHEQVRRGRKIPPKERWDILFPTGSTLLNLALSDSPQGGYAAGKIVALTGDASSGKSMQGISCLAEIATNPKWDDYRLIYDDTEHALEFDLDYLFGNLSNRIVPPAIGQEGIPLPSETIEDFQTNIFAALDARHPFIYLLDSWDALYATEEEEKVREQINARTQGKTVSGSYGTAGAKKAHQIMRLIRGRIKHSRSLLIMIFQTKDNISGWGERKTRSGGNAPYFYASYDIWLTSRGLQKAKDRVIGIDTEVKIKKNKATGKRREVRFSIYYDYGIDDLGSMIDFLLKEKEWKEIGRRIVSPWGDMSRQKLLQYVESEGLQKQLQRMVADKWIEIEDSIKLNRKPKYR